ncbi:nitric oxide-sensing protein NosP [Shewanella marina]|uniref:nitric oxide-sensing protein NosP n=1 Tax=Shewanella marina TaxID=487319 RepID=UPI000A0343F3|nr:nitric oxide-sensing protein NosP [Shewanella marina]
MNKASELDSTIIAPLQTSTPYVASAATYQLNAYCAAQELAAQLKAPELDVIIFFCSASYDLATLGPAIQQAFPNRKVVGCTTSGEITDRGYSSNSISALGFNNQVFSIATSITSLNNFSFSEAQLCVAELIKQCNKHPKASITQNSFALTLIDGLSPQEESFLATLNIALGRIPHFGGSAGDDTNLAFTHVYSDGVFHSEAAVIVLFNTTCPFDVFTSHHIESLNRKLVVTHADSEKRRVYELNAEPAALVYAREVGIDLQDLRPEIYALNPLAVQIGKEFYIRSIQKVNDDYSIDFYCAVDTGIVLTAMKPGDIFASIERELEVRQRNIGEIEVVIGCDCFLRHLEISQLAQENKINQLFSKYRLLGFNTYGEQLNGVHMNQTLTGVMIGKPK